MPSRKSKGLEKAEEEAEHARYESSLIMETERVLNTYDANSDFGMIEEKWDVEKYISRINVVVINESDDEMTLEFDLIHVEAPIANAIRRVLLAEVPTMAFEKIYLYQNTSIIQDEVLCHRLGLLPIRADPRLFEMPLTKVIGINETGVDVDEEPAGDPKRNLIFELKVACTRKTNASKTATDPQEIYENALVYSKSFDWIPIDDQATSLPYHPSMVHDDILVAKLRPGQEIEARCHCVKGIGRDHAKFSPVATASYRLLPDIVIKKKFSGDDAERIKNSFSDGVIGIDADGFAYVKDARRDTCSRNIQRHEDLSEHIELSRRKDHFIFSVESTGALKSSELVVEACRVIEEKCRTLKSLFEEKLHKCTL
ncbi:DNA-directed RNA polymerases I and III subunit RPAC1 [Toxocara canis]|uniref:DNA-directed RNA polymerases I and III subunit RPAC1 n=1 Tax=Toxocara canis TaxID=6265 RepID=A0A0B2VU64_TOXCA|nr:DNA-directed RNA polymerases I and III subunit RPAC1 [Toxocara canis]